jgi:bacterioferritin
MPGLVPGIQPSTRVAASGWLDPGDKRRDDIGYLLSESEHYLSLAEVTGGGWRCAMKGNKEVIDVLNEALKHELGAVNQYWLHYRLLDNWGYTRLARKERKESIEEMEHADKLITRIIFLEGMPNLQYVAPLMIGQHIKEVLECDLKIEFIARDLYVKGRDLCRSKEDLVSMHLFEELLRDEEGHIDFLETQLDLLDKIGEQNYGQLQADPADKVEGDA